MARIHPHINFNGTAEEAFGFYRSVFGGDFTKIIRFGDIAGPEYPIAEEEAEKIMHIELPIGPNLLMGNDVPRHMGRVNENENRSKIAVTSQSLQEAETLMDGLSRGGAIEVPWDGRFGMFRDRYGIEWIIIFDPDTV